MKKLPRIRKKITKYAIIGLTGLMLFFAVAVVTNGAWQRNQAAETIQAELLATADNQALRVLGTLLLPEELSALPMILDQIKKQENLTAISVNRYAKNQIIKANKCKPVTEIHSVCSGGTDNIVRVLTKLQHGGRTFAELTKSKAIPLQSWMSLADPQLWLFIFAFITIGGLMFKVARFVQKELCDSVVEIVKGLQKDQEYRNEIIKKQKFKELRHLARAMYGLQTQVEKKSVKESIGEISRQVAHDMKSPLSLLKVVTAESDHPMTASEKRLASQSTKRLEQIANKLLKKDTVQNIGFSTIELSSMIEGLIDEKSHHLNERVDFIFDNQIKSPIDLNSDPDTVLRTLSNLIDNSIEATVGQAQATVRIALTNDENNDIVVDILDTGMGFIENKFSQPSSKVYGHGLGVNAARRDLTEQNGALAYNSLVGAGTATRIRLV